jgi:ABC-type dipeptide/oligopeptide/nickel transport system permease subunit
MEVKAEHKIQVKKHDLVSSYIEEGKKFLKRLLNNKGAAIGGLIFLIFVLIAVLCPYISPHDPSLFFANPNSSLLQNFFPRHRWGIFMLTPIVLIDQFLRVQPRFSYPVALTGE